MSFWHCMAYVVIAVVGGSFMEATNAEVFIMMLLMLVLHDVDAIRRGKKP